MSRLSTSPTRSMTHTMLGSALILAFALTLASCAKMMDISADLSGTQPSLSDKQIDYICGLWDGVGWEDADTDETIIDVKVNNSKRDSFCTESDLRTGKK